MPVHFRKDELIDYPDCSDDGRADQADLSEVALAGLRSALICLVPSAILLVLIFRYMASSLAAASQLTNEGVLGRHLETCMPVVVFSLLGAGFGALVGWRLSATVGLVGVVGWVLAIGMILALTLVGGLTVARIFPADVPGMAWASVAAIGIAAFAGLYLFTAWTH